MKQKNIRELPLVCGEAEVKGKKSGLNQNILYIEKHNWFFLVLFR
eukprot:jgi/Antlo1/277/682